MYHFLTKNLVYMSVALLDVFSLGLVESATSESIQELTDDIVVFFSNNEQITYVKDISPSSDKIGFLPFKTVDVSHQYY